MTKFKLHLDLIIILIEMVIESMCKNGSEHSYFNSTLSISPSMHFNNHCIFHQSKGPKKWGRNCEFACNCKNNTQCHSTGFCPIGCKVGWSQATHLSPCYERHHDDATKASLAPTNSTGIKPSASSKTRSSTLNERDTKPDREMKTKHFDFTRTETSTQVDETVFLVAYSLDFDMKCKKMQDFAEISWVLRTSTPLTIYYVYVRIKRYVSFFIPEEHLRAEIRLNGYSKPIVRLVIQDTHQHAATGVYFKFFKIPVLLDTVKLSFNAYSLDSCTGLVGTGIAVLYGMPVCPFRRWGLQCERHCRCPCEVPECHPLTGSCVDRVVFCPKGKYGRDCTKTCSKFCLDDKKTPHEEFPGFFNRTRSYRNHEDQSCHVISGICRFCSDLNMTGKACEKTTDPDELALVLTTCQNATISSHGELRTDKKTPGQQPRTKKLIGTKDIWRGQIALLVVCCSVILFLIGFGVYVTCVRFWARKKFRDYMEALERQRIMRSSIKSWAELREEFKHFRDGFGSKTIDDTLTEGDVSEAQPLESSVDILKRGHSAVSPNDIDVRFIKRVSFKD